jgi:hypothetical protein
MAREKPNQELTFGYLSTVHSPDHGYFGGYLIISRTGRPLEFHCTAPIRPNRAQEILYGPTLQRYLLGEQIGGTLLAQAKLTPRLVLTDQAATLALREGSSILFVQIQRDGDPSSCPQADSNRPAEPAEGLGATLGSPVSGCLVVRGYEFQLPPGFASESVVVSDLLQELSQTVELIEPFHRIREAIYEAQRIGERRQNANGQAA